jgi:hypothetical protein
MGTGTCPSFCDFVLLSLAVAREALRAEQPVHSGMLSADLPIAAPAPIGAHHSGRLFLPPPPGHIQAAIVLAVHAIPAYLSLGPSHFQTPSIVRFTAVRGDTSTPLHTVVVVSRYSRSDSKLVVGQCKPEVDSASICNELQELSFLTTYGASIGWVGIKSATPIPIGRCPSNMQIQR